MADCTRCNFMRQRDPFAACPDHMTEAYIVALPSGRATDAWRKAVMLNDLSRRTGG